VRQLEMERTGAKLLLGIDVGTRGAKAILVTTAGNVLGNGYCAYKIKRPNEGYAEQDPEGDWWNGCRNAISEALHQAQVSPGDISALGFSTQTSNVVLVDKNGKSIRPSIIWQDRRSSRIAGQIRCTLSEAHLWTRKKFPLTAHSYLAPLLWLRQNEPEAYQNAALRLTTPGYILYRLTGRNAVDPAVASGMIPLYSLEQQGWDRRVCNLFSIPINDLPDLLSCHEIAGYLLPDAAAALGLPVNIPVIVGTGDSMADLLSAGVFSSGQVAFTYGTLFGIVKCEPNPVSDGFCLSHAIDNSYLLYSGVPLAGSTLNWFYENIGRPELTRAEKSGENPYDILSELGSTVPPGSEGLLAFPFTEHTATDTESTPGAALVGLNLRHTRGHIYRSFIEGIAYEVRRQYEGMAGAQVDMITAIGGGARDVLWTQITSDVIGVAQRIPKLRQGAPLADAYLAGWGCGLFSGIEGLAEWIKPMVIVDPNASNREIYENAYHEYLRLGTTLGILNTA
jgi:sugar (pentulose or hexulose) kinase